MKRKKTVSYRKHQERKRKISVPGISDISAARLIGECRDKKNKQTWKQTVIEAYIYNDYPDGQVYAGGEDKVFKTADQKEELPEEHICSIINTYENTDGIDKRKADL